MAKILIPRSDSISAKIIEPSDTEKVFTNAVRDYVQSGFTVTANSGTNRSVDITAGVARIKGLYVELDANDTAGYTFGTDDTHYLYITLTRDGNNEVESWNYSSNTTGTIPADSMKIAKVVTAGGDVSSVDQSAEFLTNNHLHTFMGTGAEIAALSSTYAGQLAFCTLDGDIFQEGKIYRRNTANSDWNVAESTPVFFGDGSDGDVTISTNTVLTSVKYYNNLTVDSGVSLTGNYTQPMEIYVKGRLTCNGHINVDGRGNAGGAGGHYIGSGGTGTAGTAGVNGAGSGGAGGASVQATGASGNGGNGGPGVPAYGGGAGQAGQPGHPNASSPHAGGAGGGAGSSPTDMKNLLTYITTSPKTNLFGAGGGGGGGSQKGGNGGNGSPIPAVSGGGQPGMPGGDATGGDGGAGGGFLIIYAKEIVVGSTGIISSDGSDGGDANTSLDGQSNPYKGPQQYPYYGGGSGGGGGGNGGAGGGGGGGGGTLLFVYNSLANNGTIRCAGGSGGLGNAPGGTGGAGQPTSYPQFSSPGSPGGNGTSAPSANTGSTGNTGLIKYFEI